MGEYITPWWQAAMLPDAWDVGGIVVSPMSVWHSFALCNLGNPYRFEMQAGVDDAAALLLVCARDMEQLRQLYFRPRKRRAAMLSLHRRLRGVSFSGVDRACRDYVRACTRSMRRFVEGASRAPRVPHEWHLVRTLCETYGMSTDEAWNTPYAMARAYYDVDAEANGDKSLSSIRGQQEAEQNCGELDS